MNYVLSQDTEMPYLFTIQSELAFSTPTVRAKMCVVKDPRDDGSCLGIVFDVTTVKTDDPSLVPSFKQALVEELLEQFKTTDFIYDFAGNGDFSCIAFDENSDEIHVLPAFSVVN